MQKFYTGHSAKIKIFNTIVPIWELLHIFVENFLNGTIGQIPEEADKYHL